MKKAPILEGESLRAVEHRGSHVQIIASAGSGKTEVVSQRVVSLLAEGVPAREIVAFTFTERAAKELKFRIAKFSFNPTAGVTLTTIELAILWQLALLREITNRVVVSTTLNLALILAVLLPLKMFPLPPAILQI